MDLAQAEIPGLDSFCFSVRTSNDDVVIVGNLTLVLLGIDTFDLGQASASDAWTNIEGAASSAKKCKRIDD